MHARAQRLVGFQCVLLPFLLVAISAAESYELVVPAFEYRTGPYAPSGIPIWNGFSDYLTLLNERDGGIKGIKIKIAVCETGYDSKRGVECYEKVKKEALVIVPGSTGIAYELTPKAAIDRIPILTPGYGRTSAADGRIFHWAFNFPATYWSGASIIMKYIADQERGADKLKGKRLALLYLNSPYGKEPIPILKEIARQQEFEFLLYPVEPPGKDQDAIWQQIDNDRPDWILLWGFGTMTQIAIASAAEHRFPMGHIVGSWWASAESDVRMAGDAADGYLGAALEAPGAVCPVHNDILKYVYDAGKARDSSFRPRVGEVLYNSGVVLGMWITEAIAKAMHLHRKRHVTASDVRDGLEVLELTEDRIEILGFEGMVSPIKLSCSNHEGPGKAAIRQWDAPGNRWRLVSRFYEPDRELIDPLLKAESERYAKENNIAIRSCR
jgi:branched-chain amino acid transport system substrate-binding protein